MTFQPTPLPLAEALAHARDLAQAQIEAALAERTGPVAEAMRFELSESGANYLVGQFVFGDMSPEEAEKSVAMFIEKVMPTFFLWRRKCSFNTMA